MSETHWPQDLELIPQDQSSPLFESTEPFDSNRIRAAAVYCRDDRFGEHFDELLHTCLRLPRYDRLAVPGGAACLARHFATFREAEGVIEQLRFLINVHGIERVVLIAHEGCAFYSERLSVSPLQLESQQREDMRKAVQQVRVLSRSIAVDAYFARVSVEGTVQFHMAEL